jgi:hypothetical protein
VCTELFNREKAFSCQPGLFSSKRLTFVLSLPLARSKARALCHPEISNRRQEEDDILIRKLIQKRFVKNDQNRLRFFFRILGDISRN